MQKCLNDFADIAAQIKLRAKGAKQILIVGSTDSGYIK